MTKFTFRHLKIGLIFTIFFTSHLDAKLRDFETTRLKSTAGTGVGSVLMDEATILNPAPIAFFKTSSVYLSKGSSDNTFNNQADSKTDNFSVIVSDAKSKGSGSVSYQSQSTTNQKQKRLAAAFASPVTKTSSFGASLRKTTTETIGSPKEDIIQSVFGISHVVDDGFTIGFMAKDPFKKKVSDSKGIFGAQYVYEDFISLMLDFGANYYEEISGTFLYRSAIQFKVLNDLFARFGYSRDLGEKEKVTGVGLGWVQPRLVLEIALNRLEDFNLSEKVSETSFSLSYRF